MSAPTPAVYRKYNQSAKGKARSQAYRSKEDSKMLKHFTNTSPQARLAKNLYRQGLRIGY
jgi:hypothetical protein